MPIDGLQRRRRDYEPRLAAAIPHLVEHPEVPISTGGLESLQQAVVEPVLARRRPRSATSSAPTRCWTWPSPPTTERLDDADEVAALLRADALDARGHAPPLRMVADPRGSVRYSSLRDPTLLTHLAATRGLT